MEYDSRTRKSNKGKVSSEAQYLGIDACYLLQPAWLRRAIQSSTGLDRFLLDYGFVVLPGICLAIWSILLLS